MYQDLRRCATPICPESRAKQAVSGETPDARHPIASFTDATFGPDLARDNCIDKARTIK
jgi:hypothetical protein